MRENWSMQTQFLGKDLCENIIQEFKKIPESEGGTFNGNTEHRKSKVRWVREQEALKKIILDKVNVVNAEVFNVNIQQEMAEMQFGEYSAEYGGKYDWHHDVNWENSRNYDRKLSVVIQLSDPKDYEGGRFEFSEVQSPRYDLWALQGSILIFPSYIQHRVTEVTEGVRYSLVSWVRGPRWR